LRIALILAFILLAVLSIFQISTVYQYFPGGLRPDLVGMLVLACGALWGSRKGGIIGLIAGLLVGLPLLHFWGFRVLIYSGLGMISGLVSKRFYLEHPLALGLLGILGGVLLGFLPSLLAYIFGQANSPIPVFVDFTYSLGAGLLFLFIIYHLLGFIQHRQDDRIQVNKI